MVNKKYVQMLTVFLLSLGVLTPLFSQSVKIEKMVELHRGTYYQVHEYDNLVYCAAGKAGIDVIRTYDPNNIYLHGQYDTPGTAYDVFVHNNHAYVADGDEGLLVLDITTPTIPRKAANYKMSAWAYGVYVKDNYAYVAFSSLGLLVFDVSNPQAPALVGRLLTDGSAVNVYVDGNYAYVVTGAYHPGRAGKAEKKNGNKRKNRKGKDRGKSSLNGGTWGELWVVDISNPRVPKKMGSYGSWNDAADVVVKGNYAYVTGYDYIDGSFKVFDVSDKNNIKLTGSLGADYVFSSVYYEWGRIFAAGEFDGLFIIDVDDPAAPKVISTFDTPGAAKGVFVRNMQAYVADGSLGMQIVNIADQKTPEAVNVYLPKGSDSAQRVTVEGNYAYVSNTFSYPSTLQIYDLSNPAVPNLVGEYKECSGIGVVKASGGHVFAADGTDLLVLDVSNPASPSKKSSLGLSGTLNGLEISGNYVYVSGGSEGVHVVDVSNPATPARVAGIAAHGYTVGVDVSGDRLYVADTTGGLMIYEIANPAAPSLWGSKKLDDEASAIHVFNEDVYITAGDNLYIFNAVEPWAPEVTGVYNFPAQSGLQDVFCTGITTFVASYKGIYVIDVSQHTAPGLAGQYYIPDGAFGLSARGNIIYAAADSFMTLRLKSDFPVPHLEIDKTNLIFGAKIDDGAAPPQKVKISNSGGVNLNFELVSNQSWLSVSPTYGTTGKEVFVSVTPYGLDPGTYRGTITVTDPFADNSPQYIYVKLKIEGATQTQQPFGVFSRPLDGKTVSGSIPVTGWALDDVGVQKVEIYYENGGSLAYLDDALFVEGARPDVEAAYPEYPNNHKAGWGYMLLTNYLPGGDGTYTLHAFATDVDGNRVSLGTKTITVDNANSVKPFGAIDSPGPGESVIGTGVVNFGWVLTPQPNTIPKDGSTLMVWIDGIPQGRPVYNQYRKDIAEYFPGYNNTDGAVGHFTFDANQFENGVHTIQWTVTDDAGNTDGIGSRFFSVWNYIDERSGNHSEKRFNPHAGTGPFMENLTRQAPGRDSLNRLRDVPANNELSHIEVREGYNRNASPRAINRDKGDIFTIDAQEMGRIEITLPGYETGKRLKGYHQIGAKLYPLPPGSTLDSEKGVFYWQPGPGFTGSYRLVFIEEENDRAVKRMDVMVRLLPNDLQE